MQNSTLQTTQIFLFRHAEPERNPADFFIGHFDPGLSQIGRDQAQSIRLRFPEMQRLTLWASPLRRAHETARLAFPEHELQTSVLLTERNFGVLDGLEVSSARIRYPEATESLATFPLNFVPAEAEAWPAVLDRAAKAAAWIRSQPGSKILVSHLHFLQAFVSVLTGETLARSFRRQLGFAQHWRILDPAPGSRCTIQNVEGTIDAA